MSVSVTPTAVGGALSIYLSMTNPTPTRNAGSYSWSASPMGGQLATSTVVSAQSIGQCVKCMMYIGIYNPMAVVTDFMVQAQSSGSVGSLADGLQVSGAMTIGTLNYYSFYVSQTSRLMVSSDVCTGGTGVYVSTVILYPNSTTPYTFSSGGFSRVDIMQASPGTWYIGIEGYPGRTAADDVYRLTAITEPTNSPNSKIPVPGGSGLLTATQAGTTYTVSFSPVPGDVDDGTYAYFAFYSKAGIGEWLDTPCRCANVGATYSSPITINTSQKPYIFTTTVPSATDSYIFNVVARLSASKFEIAYIPLTTTPSQSVTGGGGTSTPTPAGLAPGSVAAIVISLLLVVGIAVGVLIWRRRRQQPQISLGQIVDEPPPPSSVVYAAYGAPAPVAVTRPPITENKRSSLLSSGQNYTTLEEEEDTQVHNPPSKATSLN